MAKLKENVISDELAFNEMKSFIHRWIKRPPNDEKLAEDYIDSIEAIQSGNLIIDPETKEPVYTLVHPIMNDSKEISMSIVNFKTRVKPNTKANLASGVDLQKDAAKYGLIVVSHIIGTTVKELDKFEAIDYDVISQIASVFMLGGR